VLTHEAFVDPSVLSPPSNSMPGCNAMTKGFLNDALHAPHVSGEGRQCHVLRDGARRRF
jgi:hypothetical protein